MATKRSQSVDKEKLVDGLHAAVRAFVEGAGGNLSVIGPIEIIPHKPLSFDLVIHCVGRRPSIQRERKS